MNVMTAGLLGGLASFITATISAGSYWGIIFLMGLESANVPIPSEIVMPFSGFLASQGTLNIWLVGLAGAVGCTIGSVVSYYLGKYSNQTWIGPFVDGWGRIFITRRELEFADRWLKKYGDIVVFISRLLPIVRTFISFPAGVAGVNLTRFIILSFVGSLIWCTLLAEIGYRLGQNWNTLSPYFRQFDYLILAAVVLGLAWFIYHRVSRFNKR